MNIHGILNLFFQYKKIVLFKLGQQKQSYNNCLFLKSDNLMHTRSYPFQLTIGSGKYLQQYESYSSIYASQQPNLTNPFNSQSTLLCYAFIKTNYKSD